MHRSHLGIYQKPWHLLTTLLVVILPFVFLLAFSRIAHIATGQLFANVFISFFRIFIAYLVAPLLGWIAAAFLYRGKRAAVALPIFDVLQSFPTFALLPMVTLLWGASEITVIIFLVVTIIWPIFFSIVGSFKSMQQDWREAVRVMDLRGFAYLRYYLIPMSMPGFITGSIIGLGEGWEALVATEIIMHMKTGLGNFFEAYAQNPAITGFGILGFLILIFCINKIIWMPLLEWGHHRLEE